MALLGQQRDDPLDEAAGDGLAKREPQRAGRGRRMITIYSEYSFVSVHTPGPEADAVALEELPKPSEQWWLGAVPAHDEPP